MAVFKINLNKVLNSGGSIKVRKSDPAAQNNLSFSNYYKATADHPSAIANQYSVSGSGTSSSPMTVIVGGGNTSSSDDEDHRVWILINQTGTLSWSLQLAGNGGYMGFGRIYKHNGPPDQHTWSDLDTINSATNVSSLVITNTTISGTVSVTSGQYLIVRWQENEGTSNTNPTVTAILSIASITTTTTTTAAPTTTTTSTTTTTAAPFSPMAVMLTTGSSYTVPTGATNMKAWAIGSGGNYGRSAGGTAYKTWVVNGGSSISYSVGAAVSNTNLDAPGNNTTVTYNGTTITGFGGGRASNGTLKYNGGEFSGGDGGAIGGSIQYLGNGIWAAGAVGGNTSQNIGGYIVFKATDVDGLFAVLNLLGIDPTTNIENTKPSNPNVFGAGSHFDKYGGFISGGIGGGNGYGTNETRETGAVILYFT